MRVVIADDSVLVREGIARLLAEGGFDVVATCGDASALLVQVAEHRPDVAVVDVRMPPTRTTEGLVAAREIRRRWPATGVLVLSQHVEVGLASKLIAEGSEGVGYLLKERVDDVGDFLDAVRRVGTGGSALDPIVVSQLLARRIADDRLAGLTRREHEVLGLISEGLSNHAIAMKILVSERAVEKHVTAIFDKLALEPDDGTHRRVLAVLAFLRR